MSDDGTGDRNAPEHQRAQVPAVREEQIDGAVEEEHGQRIVEQTEGEDRVNTVGGEREHGDDDWRNLEERSVSAPSSAAILL